MPLRPKAAAVSRVAVLVVPGVADVPDDENRAVTMVLCSKRLSQCKEELSSFDSRRRVQVVTYVDSHWTHRRGITKSKAECIRVLPVKTDGAEDIATVVKSHYSEAFLDRHRNSEFRVQDHQLIAAGWHGNQRTGTRDGGITASGKGSLRPCPVQRKSA